MRAVIKFGGVSLGTGEKVKIAAESVLKAKYEEKVVVVSAPGKTTDQLLDLISSFEEKIDEREYAEILSMGERTSVKVFSSALKTLGANVRVYDPSEPDFPIVTRNGYINAEVDLEETRRGCTQIADELHSKIVVVPGFVGRGQDGVSILGRGGSDITATVLGNCLKADEVILVKDTEGIMSADPKLVKEARPVDQLSIEEMYALAHGGAKVVRPEALYFKLPTQRLRIVQFGKPIDTGGTEILGAINPDKPAVVIERGIREITVVCSSMSGVIPEVTKKLGERLVGIGTASHNVTFFFTGEDWADICRLAHGLEGVKAVSGKDGIGSVSLLHPYLVDRPGVVAKAATLLSLNGINIYEITSSKGSLTLFILERDLEKAKQLLEENVIV
ncbi:MAG: aspartate kinase [Conexivisphaerales archaeon]